MVPKPSAVRVRVIHVTLALLAAASFPACVHAEGLRAGAAAVDIMPAKWPVVVNGSFLSKQADRALDPLHARCVVLDDGRTTIALCVVDTCVIPHELVAEARRMIAAATGIPGERVMISATHTHSAPSLIRGEVRHPLRRRHVPGNEWRRALDGLRQARAETHDRRLRGVSREARPRRRTAA